MEFQVGAEARAVLDEAAVLSMRRGKFYVGVEYILEALISRPRLLPAEFAAKHMQGLGAALGAIRGAEWQGVTPITDTAEVYYTPRALEVMREASRVAHKLRRGDMQPAHLLLVILRQDTAEVCRIMDAEGIDRTALAESLLKCMLEAQKLSQARNAEAAVAAKATDAPGEPVFNVEDFTTDLTEAARRGEVSKPFGRDRELMETIQVLLRKEKNNVILLGNPGVGKTKIVEGLAAGIASGELRAMIGKQRIIELNLAALLSGTQYRGTFETKLLALLQDMERAGDKILFIDEIHLIMGAGATDGDGSDMANFLKPALGRGKLKCIGATTPEEYRKFIAKDPAIERRFQTVKIDGLSPENTHELLRRLKPGFERHHGVAIGKGTLTAAVKLAERYLPRREFPDKAIDVVDQACARFHLKLVLAQTNPKELKSTVDPRIAGRVTPHDVKKVVSAMCSMSLEDLDGQERAKLSNLEALLSARIIGQPAAIAKVAPPIRKSKMGMANPKRPDASLFFLGPTGVGKTQLAKELAAQIFGSEELLYIFDMTEYVEAHAVSRLLGAPPGYVGHDDDGPLYVYMLNTPYCILLFDEIEKAHPQIFDVFLPMLDEGRLRDSKGREISFKHAILLFTSNVGAEVLDREQSDEVNQERLQAELAQHFRPEFLNRMDAFVPFFPMRREDIRSVLRLMIDEMRERLAEHKIGIRMFESTYQFLADRGYDPKYGARELKRAVERYIADPISQSLLHREFKAGDMIDIRSDGKELSFQRGEQPKHVEPAP